MKIRFKTPISWIGSLSGVSLFCISVWGAAHAAPPTVRTALAIKNIQMAAPLSFEDVFASKLIGLDRESPETRQRILKQAADYADFRKGRMPAKQGALWLEKCRQESAKGESDRPSNGKENAFCAYELKRRDLFGSANKLTRTHRHRSLATELKAGNFSAIAQHSPADLSASLRLLEGERRLSEVAMRAADQTECLPSGASSAIGYKLEERFPAIEIVELTKRLYRQASTCGQDLAAAQASFRLGLIHIWQENCSPVGALMQKVEATPEASQFHARAKYWRFYCAEKTGDQINRDIAKSSLLKDHPMSFQTLAATAEDPSGIDQALRQPAPQVALRSLVRPDLNPTLAATEALIQVEADNLAAEMIQRAIKDIGNLEPEVRLYVAIMMNRIGSTLPKFKILNDLFQDAPETVSLPTLKLFFPLAYFDIVRSKQEEIDPLLILSLIRQESAFNKVARSIAGARGLMQVMPATARLVSRSSVQRLFDPSTNIDVGTRYFMSQLRQHEGDVELTLAAYNAGTNRVEDWRKRYPTDNRLLFLDFIPFRETREYVSSILRNYYWYVKLYSPTGSEAKTEAKTAENSSSVSPKARAIVSATAGIAAGSLISRAPGSVINDAATGKRN